MYWIISVSYNGGHVFSTTHMNSIVYARKTHALLLDRFKQVDGYTVTATKWENVGKQVDAI